MTTKRKINILTLFVIVLLLLIIFLYNKVYYAEQLVDKTNKVLVVENENLSDYNKAILNKAKKRYSDNGYSTKQYIEYVNKVSSSIDTCIALVQKMKTTVNDDENLKLKLSKIRELFIDENYYSTYINRFNILFNSETLNFYLKNDRFKRERLNLLIYELNKYKRDLLSSFFSHSLYEFNLPKSYWINPYSLKLSYSADL